MKGATIKYPSIDHLEIARTRDWSGSKNGEEENIYWHLSEKMDGSQLSFTVNQTNNHNNIEFFNKGKAITADSVHFGIFRNAILALSEITERFDTKLVYHGEAICKQKHNVINYNRAPKYYFILYDISNKLSGEYLDVQAMLKHGKEIELETVNILYENNDPSTKPIDKCLEIFQQITDGLIDSKLGGDIEGIVVKHHRFVKGIKTSATKLKIVREQYKESHCRTRSSNKEGSSIKTRVKRIKKQKYANKLLELLEQEGRIYNCERRFQKANQRLLENGSYPTDTPSREHIITLLEQDLDDDFDKEYGFLYTEINRGLIEIPLGSSATASVIVLNRYATLKRHARASLAFWVTENLQL